MNNGLANMVTLARLSRGRPGESVTLGGPASDLILISQYVIFRGGCFLNGTFCPGQKYLVAAALASVLDKRKFHLPRVYFIV
jgi:hypothetical protein